MYGTFYLFNGVEVLVVREAHKFSQFDSSLSAACRSRRWSWNQDSIPFNAMGALYT